MTVTTVTKARRVAKDLGWPDMETALAAFDEQGMDLVEVDATPDGDAGVGEPETAMLCVPLDMMDDELDVIGGETFHHITLSFFGPLAGLSTEDQQKVLGVVAALAQSAPQLRGVLSGTDLFEAEDGSTVWWAKPWVDGLLALRAQAVSMLQQAGIDLSADDHLEEWTPHVTLAYLPVGQEPPDVELPTTPLNVDRVCLCLGGRRYDFPLTGEPTPVDTASAQAANESGWHASAFVPNVAKGLLTDPEAAPDDQRYTFGPVYVPDFIDGQGDWTDPDTLEQAVRDYFGAGQFDIHLQHSDAVAGQCVGILVWPFPVTIPVYQADTDSWEAQSFPAGTPFMGTLWTPEVWPLVKSGQIRGYSMGGDALRVDLGMSDEEVTKAAATAADALAGSKPDLNDSEVTFLRDMIANHQVAIQMSQQLLTDNLGVTGPAETLAQQIIAAQQTQIDQMAGWLTAAGQDPKGGKAAGK